jgi:hypothetical protein
MQLLRVLLREIFVLWRCQHGQVDLDLKDRGRIPGYYEQDKQVLKAYQVRNGIFDKLSSTACMEQSMRSLSGAMHILFLTLVDQAAMSSNSWLEAGDCS